MTKVERKDPPQTIPTIPLSMRIGISKNNSHFKFYNCFMDNFYLVIVGFILWASSASLSLYKPPPFTTILHQPSRFDQIQFPSYQTLHYWFNPPLLWPLRRSITYLPLYIHLNNRLLSILSAWPNHRKLSLILLYIRSPHYTTF